MEANINDYGQMNFNLPHDVVPLPSGGIFYQSKKKAVKIGYLTAADENILLNIEGNKTIKETIVLPLLRSKLYEPDLRPEDLLDGDIEAILLFLRNTSFGPEYNITLIDPKTEKKFEASILLDEMNIKRCEAQPDSDGTFLVSLPRSKTPVRLKLLTLRDSLEIERAVESYPQGRIAPIITLRLANQIVEVGGVKDKGEIAKFVDSMPIMDSKYIRKFLNDNEPRLDLNKEVIAPSGEKVNVGITFGVEFFRPFF